MHPQLFLDLLLSRNIEAVAQLEAYDLVVLLAALARTRYRPYAEWMNTFFAASQQHLPIYGPGYLYTLLRWVRQHMTVGFRGVHCNTNILHCAATCTATCSNCFV
jgi:hypothetical protein